MLTPFQQALILSLCPAGAQITAACYFQEEYLPCPIQVTVTDAHSATQTFVLRIVRRVDDDIRREVALLPVLHARGLPVPIVLAGPAYDPAQPEQPAVAVYSFLPGVTLQQISEQSAADLERAKLLLVEAVDRLAVLTKLLQADLARSPELATQLPRITLLDRWQQIIDQGGPWLQNALFGNALEVLRPTLAAIETDLVFTNGDYQPANFLSDGEQVTGFVDFELASFQDYLFGFAKYPIYDLHPLNKGGMIDYLLAQKGVTFADFAPRLALGCLATLQREIAVTGGDEAYRAHVLGRLAQALQAMPAA